MTYEIKKKKVKISGELHINVFLFFFNADINI